MITAHIYQCAVCHLRGPQKGCKYRRVRGVRTKVCGPCAERQAKPAAEKEKVAA